MFHQSRKPHFQLQQTESTPKSEQIVLYCEQCDKEFKQKGAFDAHIATHEKCKQPGCTFSGTRKVVQAHFLSAHGEFSGSGYKMIDVEGQKFRVLLGTSPDEVEQWRAERRKKFPTQESIEKKILEHEELKRCGGLFPQDKKRRSGRGGRGGDRDKVARSRGGREWGDHGSKIGGDCDVTGDAVGSDEASQNTLIMEQTNTQGDYVSSGQTLTKFSRYEQWEAQRRSSKVSFLHSVATTTAATINGILEAGTDINLVYPSSSSIKSAGAHEVEVNVLSMLTGYESSGSEGSGAVDIRDDDDGAPVDKRDDDGGTPVGAVDKQSDFNESLVAATAASSIPMITSSFEVELEVGSTKTNARDGKKKSVCIYFARGNCKHGVECSFSHEFEPRLCKNYMVYGGRCHRQRCSFMHDKQALQEYRVFEKAKLSTADNNDKKSSSSGGCNSSNSNDSGNGGSNGNSNSDAKALLYLESDDLIGKEIGSGHSRENSGHKRQNSCMQNNAGSRKGF